MTTRRQQISDSEIPDPQIRDSAVQFYDAWCLLREQPHGFGVLPRINAGAIAIELYLKSLAPLTFRTPDTLLDDFSAPDGTLINWTGMTAKSQKSGHTPTELFNAIEDSEIRERIIFAFSSKHSVNKGAFIDVLEAIRDAFLISRYVYEYPKGLNQFPFEDFERVVQFLHDFVSGPAKP